MKEKIDDKILNKLLNSSEPITSNQLAESVGVSEKTILKYLNLLKSEIKKHGAKIEIKQGAGSYLVIEDKDVFYSFIKQNKDDIYNDPDARLKYVLLRLMTDGDYINIYDIADELAVSPSLMRTIIRQQIGDLMPKYNLTLDHSHTHGYRIIGSESDIRNCISKECKDNIDLDEFLNQSDLKTHDIKEIENLLTQSLEKFNVALSSDAINSLTLHILIANNRIETDNTIKVEDKLFRLRSSPEYFAISYFNKLLNEKFNITFPENEMLYLTMHINGKQRLYGHEQIQVKVNHDALFFYNKFLRNILDYGHVDFFEDEELRVSLLNHIVPFLNRVNNNMQISKIEIINAKNEFPYAYELALYGMQYFTSKNIEIAVPEISYFALHLALALEKNKTSNERANILVVCNQVANIFRIFSYKLNKSFQEQINSIKFITYKEYENYDLQDYNLILNTTNNLVVSTLPVINVSNALTFNDINIIHEELDKLNTNKQVQQLLTKQLFFTFPATNQYNILYKLITYINEIIELPDDFLYRINEREKLETTEYDNFIAIPHPLYSDDVENFIAIAKLNKPVLWKDKKVQLVFLVCTHNLNDVTSNFFNKISKLVADKNLVNDLLNTTNYKEFMDVFNNI